MWEHSATHYTRSEEHTSELQSHLNLACRLLLEKKKASIGTGCVCVSGCVCASVCVSVCVSERYTWCVQQMKGEKDSEERRHRQRVFLIDRPTTEFSSFPLRAPLPI